MPVRTLQELSDETRELSDTEGKLTRHPVLRVTALVNQSLQRLQELVSRNGHLYYMVSSVTGPVVLPSVGTPQQVFPFGGSGRFYAVLLSEGEDFWQLDDLSPQELAFWRSQPDGRPVVFRVINSDPITPQQIIEMYPAPDKAYGFEGWVLPEFSPLVNQSDQFSDHFGWAEWATNDAAQKLCQKDNDRDRFAMCTQKKAELEAEIIRMGSKQSRVRPGRRRNTRIHRMNDRATGRKVFT